MNQSKNAALDMHARAAATLYGIITFDQFFRILKEYYPEDPISQESVERYFRTFQNDDPTYYIRDQLIIHTSISPDEIRSTCAEIQKNAAKEQLTRYRILPQKYFLEYANPSFYEDGDGVNMMKNYLTNDLKIAEEEAGEILTEMAFLVRSDAVPNYIMSALKRRGLPHGKECELMLITNGCEMESDIRKWVTLGYDGHEVAKLN